MTPPPTGRHRTPNATNPQIISSPFTISSIHLHTHMHQFPLWSRTGFRLGRRGTPERRNGRVTRTGSRDSFMGPSKITRNLAPAQSIRVAADLGSNTETGLNEQHVYVVFTTSDARSYGISQKTHVVLAGHMMQTLLKRSNRYTQFPDASIFLQSASYS